MTSTAHVDVAVVGSGTAGAAVAERLCEVVPELSVAVIERGPLVLRSHFYNSGSALSQRDAFVEEHRLTPWTGSLSAGGAILPMVGGRGVVGGAQLHRFYAEDMRLWHDGRWPIEPQELDQYFDLAERAIQGRRVASGQGQRYVLNLLSAYAPAHPPHANVDPDDASVSDGFPHRSSVERLLSVVGAGAGPGVRLYDRMLAARIEFDRNSPATATSLLCLPLDGRDRVPQRIAFDSLVLAASPVESARLLLNSIPRVTLSPAVGRYLAEHIYVRGQLDISAQAWAHAPLNVFLPPRTADLRARFQVEIRSSGTDAQGRSLVRVTGSSAMDPAPENRVWVTADDPDEHGVPRVTTQLALSAVDAERVEAMRATLEEIRQLLGGYWAAPPDILPAGGSFHESGTLRIGATTGASRAADPTGLIDGTSNVYTGDAAAFPTVGVANPILTLTAMGYRLADTLARRVQ